MREKLLKYAVVSVFCVAAVTGFRAFLRLSEVSASEERHMRCELIEEGRKDPGVRITLNELEWYRRFCQ